MDKTLDELFRQSQQRLKRISSTPELDTQVLFCAALKRSNAWLYANLKTIPSPRQLSALKSFLDRRINGEPVAYITGIKEFFGLPFLVSKDVLIPRWETELLVEQTIAEILRSTNKKQGARAEKIVIVDVGCGSGCIAVAVAKKLTRSPHRQKYAFFACDISSKALAVALTNARRNRVAHKITFLRSDLLSAFMEKKKER